jgi:LysM repeat protein
MSDIVSVNPIPNKHFLSIGQKLIIPLEPDAHRAETWIREPAASESFRSTGKEPAKAHLHQVSEGETLSSISRRYRVSEKDLRRWNSDLQLPLRPLQPMLVYLPAPRREDSLTMNVPSS